MKNQKKKEKPESEKKFSPEKDEFDELSEKACTGDIRSMMLLLKKHENRGYDLSLSEIDELLS